MTVRVDRTGPITTVVIDRPEARNAVDGPTAAALADAFREFDADDSQSVAVLYGDGGTFCAGADLKAIGTERGNQVDPDGDGPMGPSRMRLSKPVIAAVEGHAVAGGLELAIWCDLRVVASDAIFGVYCRRWGVPLIDGGTVRLPRLIGEGRALDLILTGRGGVRRRGAADRARGPRRRARHHPGPGRGAGRAAGRAAAGLPAQRPALGARPARVSRSRRRCGSSWSTGCVRSRPARSTARRGSPAAPGATAPARATSAGRPPSGCPARLR